MFHEGTLQSGIALAIKEQKLVACLVRDDSEEGAIWEDEWLQSGWVSSLLEQKAVVLRLEAGSTEAGFLSAFCPLPKTPVFVVIQNGQLREQLASGISKDEFINRVRTVLGASAIPSAASSRPQETTNPPTPAPPAHVGSAPPVVANSPATIPTSVSASATPQSTTPVQTPSSKAKGKQKAVPPDPEPKKSVSSTNSAQQAARDALRKKKQEEKEDLARIQARIEADKAERKSQALAQKAERKRLGNTAPSQSELQSLTSSKGSQAKQVHLNVRLFDGRTIRSTFARTAKLQNDVRPWIDKEFAKESEDARQQHPPYIFKQILAPLPSRELSTGDESETLGDIDLAPSATLVLIPVKGYTEAYSGGSGGVVSGVVNGVTGLVGGAFGLAYNTIGYVGNSLGSIVGYGGTAAQEAEQPLAGRSVGETPTDTSSSNAPAAASIRVRTLADQRAHEPRQQFYNGNTLDFEPNEGEPSRK